MLCWNGPLARGLATEDNASPSVADATYLHVRVQGLSPSAKKEAQTENTCSARGLQSRKGG